MSDLTGGMHDGAGCINDVAQLWSLPWHELQRRLAGSIGLSSPCEKQTATIRRPARPVARLAVCAPTVTWLERARVGSWSEKSASK